MKCLRFILHRLVFAAFTRIGRVKPVCEVMGCLQSIDSKQANFPSNAYIDIEFFSAVHDYMISAQPA